MEKQAEPAWKPKTEPIVRFWTDDGLCRGIPFYSVAECEYWPDKQGLKIMCQAGLLVIEGPKVWELYKEFCKNKATDVKADGKDIMTVQLFERKEADYDKDKGSDNG